MANRVDLLERLVQSSPDAYTNWELLRGLAELTGVGTSEPVLLRRTPVPLSLMPCFSVRSLTSSP